MRNRVGRVAAICGVAFACGAGAAIASGQFSASTSTSTSVINGCMRKDNGVLRIVTHGTPCRPNETALSWNVKGLKGDTGAPGPKGDTGAIGAPGPKGNTGPAGAGGAPGAKGDMGATGAQGPKGDTGPAGTNGVPGTPGLKGDTGATGPQGSQGPAGPSGPSGPKGDSATADSFVAQFGTQTNQGRSTIVTPKCTVGEILLTAGAYEGDGAVLANGELLPINQQYAGLFTVIGTTYGGNGTTNFAVPDMRAITPNHMTYSICYGGTQPIG